MLQVISRSSTEYVDGDAPLLFPGPAPVAHLTQCMFSALDVSCGLLLLGSLKVCGVVACVSGVLVSMLPSLTPLYSRNPHTVHVPVPSIPTLLVPPLTSNPSYGHSRVSQLLSFNNNCSSSGLVCMVVVTLAQSATGALHRYLTSEECHPLLQ